jgi:hypothetical protein
MEIGELHDVISTSIITEQVVKFYEEKGKSAAFNITVVGTSETSLIFHNLPSL